MQKYSTSERLACELVRLSRTAYRYMPLPRNDEEPLRAEVIRMAGTYGRYGYRFIAGMIRNAGSAQATTKVARIWRKEGLKIPKSSRLEAGCGSSMVAACGCEPPTPTRCGVMTLSKLGMRMAARSACLPRLMNSVENV